MIVQSAVKPFVLAFVLCAAPFAHAQRSFVEARYLPGNEIWHFGIVRIHSLIPEFPVTVSSPLTVNVIACNAKGEWLKPQNGPRTIDWMYQRPEDHVLTRDITEIPIGTYKSGEAVGTFETAIYNYDVSAIARVWIYFSISVEKRGEKKVLIEVPNTEVRRAIGRRVGG